MAADGEEAGRAGTDARRPRGPWDRDDPAPAHRPGHAPPPRPAALVMALVLTLAALTALLAVLDARGAFRVPPAPRAAPPPAPPRGDPRTEVPRDALATTDPRGWFTSEDYPAAALAGRLEGRVRVAYGIAADGTVADCRVIETSGSPLLDATTCGLLRQRGRYWPARDRHGRAVADTATRAVRWVAPAE